MSTGDESIDPRVLREAAVWLMRLQSSAVDSRDRAGLAAWRRRNPEHERAWLRAERLIGTVGAIPPGLGARTLNRLDAGRPDSGRRATLKLLTALLMAPPVAWLGLRASPWRDVLAAYHTATGERREVMLADNSRVLLNTGSAIDVSFDAAARAVVLRRGEILVTTATDSAAQRPFWVVTGQGRMQALGTRFLVRQLAASSRLDVLDGAVDVCTASSGARRIVKAGDGVEFTASSIGAAHAVAPVADGWSRGILHADNQRLADFLAELSRYRPGVLRCDPAIADLRISGTFQLADTDRLLELLSKNHPLRIEARTRWWVSVHPA